MDTKWKNFSRSLIVRMILHAMLIVSMVVGTINLGTAIQIEYQNDFHSEDSLLGNKKLTEEIKDGLQIYLRDEMLKNAISNMSEKEKKENQKLLDQQKVRVDGLADKFHFDLTYEETNEAPIYIAYQGVKNGNEYVKNWVNNYQQKECSFGWLQINDVINEICKGDYVLSSYAAQEMVDHLEIYRKNLKDFLCECTGTDTGYQEVSCETYYKIYQSAPNEDAISGMGELEYDPTSGLFWDESEMMYYEPKKQFWLTADQDVYKEYVNKMKKQKQEQAKDPESMEVPKENNAYKLTNAERKLLKENIQKALFYQDSEIYLDASCLQVPVSVVFGTPDSYSMSFSVQEAYFNEKQTPYIQKNKEMKENNKKTDKIKERCGVVFAISVGVYALALLGILYVCGRRKGTEKVQLLTFDHWYTEIQVILCIAFGVLIMGTLGMVPYDRTKEIWLMLAVVAFGIFVLTQCLISFVRKAKAKCLLKQSILGKIILNQQEKLYTSNLARTALFFTVFIPAILAVMLLFSVYVGSIVLFVFVAILCVAVWIFFIIALRNYCVKLGMLRDGLQRVRAGDLAYKIPTDESKQFLNLMAKDINSISDGLGNAVEEMVKSEKLKTELISNVSHDIKTPLTSIITYVDLMKKEDVKPENVKEYIEVLDQKSQRLKALTDDLFEAAKATSGAMKLETMQMDVGALLNQAVGEFDEKFAKSELVVKNTIAQDTYFIMADGRLVWRIFENLFNNVSKYALPGSRVYVDAQEKENFIEITVKNISGSELNISPEELMQRFTRGDRSRNTEGSGLGLNITQSLAELHGGQFHVEIDGDLFKAIVELPKVLPEHMQSFEK